MKRLTIATLAIWLAFGAAPARAETIWEYVIRLATGGTKPTAAAKPVAWPAGAITSDPRGLLGACQHWLAVKAMPSGSKKSSVDQRVGEAACQSYIHGFFGGSIASGKTGCPTAKYKNDRDGVTALVTFLDGYNKRSKPFMDKETKFTSGMMMGLFIYQDVLCEPKAGK